MSALWLSLTTLALLLAAFLTWIWIRGERTSILVAAFGDKQEGEILADLIRGFHDEYPHIQVKVIQYPFREYANGVRSSIAQGEGPDVLVMDSVHYTDMVLDDILEPVYPYFLDDRMNLTDYYPQLVDRFFLHGFLYALPRDAAPVCMIYYNKKAFEETQTPFPTDDWTWETFVETAKRVMKYDEAGRVERWGFIETWAMIESWVYSAGGSFVDNVKSPNRWTLAEDKNSLRGLQFRRDMIHKHKIMPPPSVWTGDDDCEGAEMFASGKAAMFLGGLWKTPLFREIKDFDWDVAMAPRVPGGGLDFFISGSAYGIGKSSRHKKAAWKFIRYTVSERGVRQLTANGLTQPAQMRMADSPVFLDGRSPHNKKILLQAMNRGKFTPLCKNWPEVKWAIDNAFKPVWEGTATVESALESLKPLFEKCPPTRSVRP